jgi:hypothetical protein
MARIVRVHHVDKNAFLKGNIEPDTDELGMVFERTPNYSEVLEQVRIDLHWNEPSGVVDLEGRHNVGVWDTHMLEGNVYQPRATLGCIHRDGGGIRRQGSRVVCHQKG